MRTPGSGPCFADMFGKIKYHHADGTKRPFLSTGRVDEAISRMVFGDMRRVCKILPRPPPEKTAMYNSRTDVAREIHEGGFMSEIKRNFKNIYEWRYLPNSPAGCHL